jgi:hypothetical protein
VNSWGLSSCFGFLENPSCLFISENGIILLLNFQMTKMNHIISFRRETVWLTILVGSKISDRNLIYILSSSDSRSHLTYTVSISVKTSNGGWGKQASLVKMHSCLSARDFEKEICVE